MNNSELVEMLCSLVEAQANLIHKLATELDHARGLNEAEQQMVAELDNRASKIDI